jgi:release factor glutamine methyltransferase
LPSREAYVSTPSPTNAGEAPWTVARILEWTTQHLKKSGCETPRLDAELLLAHARGCPRIQLYVQFQQVVSDAQRGVMRDLVKRRAGAEPVAYLIGHREFFSLDFEVTHDTLIPRPDTETLVLELVTGARRQSEPRILDLGTGSGCIAISTAVNVPQARVTAVDLSPAALDVARRNTHRHKVESRVELVQGDLFASLPTGTRFDWIASNPPYIPHAELATLSADVRLHEPTLALDGGPDGLDVIRRLVAEAPGWLNPGGTLLVEFTPEQASTLVALVEGAGGWHGVRVLKDLAGRARVLVASRDS